jgi:hypothetical protein
LSEFAYCILLKALLAGLASVPDAGAGLSVSGAEAMGKQTDSNHGEGNPEAAAEFNSNEQAFVNSARGKQKIAEGPQVGPKDEASLLEAERKGRERAKGDDQPTARPRKD